MKKPHDVKDLKLAEKGRGRIEWASRSMPVLASIQERLRPQMTMDDGCDLVSALNSDRRELLENVIGGTEETTTGVIRLRAMEKSGTLAFPVISVNDALTKHMFDNRYGTGQSTLDGMVRA